MGTREGGAARRGVQQERLGRVQFVADDPREERRVLRVVEGPVQVQGGARLRVEQGARGRVGRVGGVQADLDALLPSSSSSPLRISWGSSGSRRDSGPKRTGRPGAGPRGR